MRERKRLESSLSTEADLARRVGDIDAYFELAREGEQVEPELKREIDALQVQVDKLETETLLSGPNDLLNAIVTIHPGAGGTESQDWADMLLRMYLRWAEREGFSAVVNDYQPGEEAGLKSATFTVTGNYAYGMLTSEIGVHRLLIRRSGGIRRSAACSSLRKSTRAYKSISSLRTFAQIRIVPAARAAST
jgi:peptide chain release factor 2